MTSLQLDDSMLFSSLPKWKKPWHEWFLGYGILTVVIAIAVWIPVLHPEILEQPKKDYHAIELVPTPVPVNHAPQRRLPQPVVQAKLDPPPVTLHLAAPRPQPKPRVIENTRAPEVKLATKKLDPLPATPPIMPKQAVRTNVFSTGSSAPQTVNRPAAQVQTGGFGDPHGVPARTTQTRAVNIASAGGFDMPTGPGYGNGTGGTHGVRGVVASTGFGNGVAVQPAHTGAEGAVRQAGFGDADVPAPPTVQSRPAQAVAKMVPAEILSKPVPMYTEEARAQHIEGEVLLEVVFEASGKLRVLKVVRGLGHGLDDAATRAAEQIRFKPALRDGQPSDSTAVVHIIFQLA
ncbi:MAG: TonB family protein [Candidatus Sulfotelmatobacter sp.]